jgi:hypothetical protein
MFIVNTEKESDNVSSARYVSAFHSMRAFFTYLHAQAPCLSPAKKTLKEGEFTT